MTLNVMLLCFPLQGDNDPVDVVEIGSIHKLFIGL
jgi:hypothetical protein